MLFTFLVILIKFLGVLLVVSGLLVAFFANAIFVVLMYTKTFEAWIPTHWQTLGIVLVGLVISAIGVLMVLMVG